MERKMLRLAIFASIVVAGLFLSLGYRATPASAQGSSQASQSGVPRNAVLLLRLINTAEMRFHNSGTYANWSQLVRSGIPQEIMQEMSRRMGGVVGRPGDELSLASPQPVRGYSLTMDVAQGGRNYMCLLRDTSQARCRPSFYTDQRGLILEATPLGCK